MWIIFFLLGGLLALGFLIVVWRKRQWPIFLRAILTLAAAAIVIYVAWVFVAALTGRQ
ncbi:MAG TPA: hypothetical protein VEH26_04900 [Chthoniobacterales bacterium]|nr:hypothetical protein [Chthoniobacterales bacterium]